MEKAAGHQRPSSLGSRKFEVSMTKHVMLNNIQHKNLRVITRHAGGIRRQRRHRDGRTRRNSPTSSANTRSSSARTRRPASISSIALLGLAKDENLFLEGDAGRRVMCRASSRADRSSSAFRNARRAATCRSEPMIHVDLDDPRVSDTEGEPVFLRQRRQQPLSRAAWWPS